MNLLQKARELEARLAGTLDRTVEEFVRSGAREPLEIVHGIVEAAQRQVQSSGRGRRVFPFNDVTVTIVAASRDIRARFEAVLADGQSLRGRIVTQLAAAGCAIDDIDLDVTVNYESRPRKGWANQDFDIEFTRVEKSARRLREADALPPRLELTVVNGTAERKTYALTSARIDIGRCPEVRDNHHRLLRTNHVAFLERSGDINQSVSRRHAHITFDPHSGSFRLHDDGSEHGTGIVRHGRSLPVPRGARGVRLESADEIVLGDARLRVRFVADTGR
jgi:hypothetical protein